MVHFDHFCDWLLGLSRLLIGGLYPELKWITQLSTLGGPSGEPGFCIFCNTAQGIYFNEILFEIQIFSFKEMCLNMSSAKWRPLFCQILVKTATFQNGHTQNGHKTFCYQNGHNQNGHTAFGQNGHRGRITTKTATLHLVKTATGGGSLPKRPHCIWSKATEGCSLPKRPHYSKNGHRDRDTSHDP